MKYLVVINCPKTGLEVPTGIVTDIATFDELPKGKSQLRCPACGETHDWSASDAMLALSSATLSSGREKAGREEV